MNVTLVEVICPTCACVHGIPTTLNDQGMKHREKRKLYCPNGHEWWYITPKQEDQEQSTDARIIGLNKQIKGLTAQLREKDELIERLGGKNIVKATFGKSA